MLDGHLRARFLSSLLLCVLGACGGSAPAAESPSGKGEGSPESGADSDGTSGDDASEAGEGESSASSAPAKPSCDDGTCSPCGDALCPSGWYCDESAPGGPACGWLPECATKASCSCVKRAFDGCSCEDRAGSAHVRCG
jgi:hypothetical protein